MGPFAQRSWIAALVELSIAILFIALAALGKIPTPTIPLFLLAWLSLWLRKTSWKRIGLSLPERWKPLILLAILIGSLYQLMSIFILVPFVQTVTGKTVDLSQFEPLQNNVPLLLTGLILTWTLAAFGEEMVFRGYLLNRVVDLFQNNGLGWVVAVLITSSLFGLAHLPQGLPGLVDNVFMGAVMAMLYLNSHKNLWLPILTHGIIDTIGFTLIFLGYYASPAG